MIAGAFFLAPHFDDVLLNLNDFDLETRPSVFCDFTCFI